MNTTTRMSRWHQRFSSSLILVALGVLLVVATFEFPIASTMRACGSGTTTWSPIAGVSLPIVNLKGIELSELAFSWSNNCNGQASSLVPVFAAVTCVAGAVSVGIKRE
jgi:hypothetical protein